MSGRARRERGHGHGWRNQQIVALHELAHHRAQLCASQREPVHIAKSETFADLGLCAEIGVGHGLLCRRHRRPHLMRDRKPDTGHDVERVSKTGIALFNVRAERLEHRHRLRHALGDIRINVGVTERR